MEYSNFKPYNLINQTNTTTLNQSCR